MNWGRRNALLHYNAHNTIKNNTLVSSKSGPPAAIIVGIPSIEGRIKSLTVIVEI